MTNDQPQWMTEHEERDNERFAAQGKRFDEMATKRDLELLATKKDIQELLKTLESFNSAVKIVSSSGKWLYRFALVLASLIVAFTVISGGWKAIVVWLFGPKL